MKQIDEQVKKETKYKDRTRTKLRGRGTAKKKNSKK
jgi:hypothetical protein